MTKTTCIVILLCTTKQGDHCNEHEHHGGMAGQPPPETIWKFPRNNFLYYEHHIYAIQPWYLYHSNTKKLSAVILGNDVITACIAILRENLTNTSPQRSILSNFTYHLIFSKLEVPLLLGMPCSQQIGNGCSITFVNQKWWYGLIHGECMYFVFVFL